MTHLYFTGKTPQEDLGLNMRLQRLEDRLKEDVACCDIPEDYVDLLREQKGECFQHESNAFILYGTELQEFAEDQFGDSLLTANIKAVGKEQITPDEIVVGQMHFDALLIYSTEEGLYNLTSSTTGAITESYSSINDFIETGPHIDKEPPNTEHGFN